MHILLLLSTIQQQMIPDRQPLTTNSFALSTKKMHAIKSILVLKVVNSQLSSAHGGVYGQIRVLLGLMNVSAVFQRFVEQSFQNYRGHFVVSYLDDLFVFSNDFGSHLNHFQLTLQELRKYGVKTKAKKWQLYRRQMWHLGRIVAADGNRLNPNSIRAVKNLV